jgi:hypothetical protein
VLTPQTEERERAVREEARRLRELRALVDLASSVIVQGRLGRAEALELVGATRRRILAPRFARLVAEHGRPAARVLPFPR